MKAIVEKGWNQQLAGALPLLAAVCLHVAAVVTAAGILNALMLSFLLFLWAAFITATVLLSRSERGAV